MADRIEDLQAILNEVRDNAEDGLDPGDALTAKEALARILCNVVGITGEDVYADDPTVGGALVPCILRWSEDRPGERAGWRDRLERARLIRGWVVG